MAQVIVRNLDDAVVEALRAKAQLHKRSLEHELRLILTAAARSTPEERIALAEQIRAMTPSAPQSDSTALVREDRDR